MSEQGKWGIVWLCALLFVSVLAASFWTPRDQSVPVSEKDAVADVLDGTLGYTNNFAHQMNDILASVVEKVMPGVVVIRTEKIGVKIHRDSLGNPWYGVRQNLMGEGSGVIVDPRGYVLTSWHVIEGAMAQRIEVVLNDETKLPARYVGHDKATDLAVLKIKGGERVFPAVEAGDSDTLRIGHMVLAMGSPYSLQSSVAMGHVSQKGRHVQILPYEDFIQTDIALNQGNSGGPLVDVDGHLVGINAAMLGEGTGIAFSVPSNLAMVVAKSIIENGSHEWPWVGAFFRKGETEGSCPEVDKVYADTPAAKAGINPGDKVLSVNDKAVRTPADVLREIFNHPVGAEVSIALQRNDGVPFTVNLALEPFPGNPY